MKMKIEHLDVFTWLATLFSISVGDVESIVSIIAACLAIISGIITIIFKLKKYLSDGKLSDEELKDIQDTIDDTIDKIDKIDKNK